MSGESLILSIIFIPLAGAFILPLLARVSPRLRNFCAFFFIAAPLAFSLKLIPVALTGKTLIISRQLIFGFNFTLQADSLAVFMACVSSLISTVIVFYSLGYISHYKNQNEYYCMVVLFLGAMMGLVFSANLIFLYLFWEITAITSWRLIGFFRESTDVFKADKSFLVTVFGALLMLLGFIMLAQQAGSFDLPLIKNALRNNSVSNIALALILAGILSKSATLPFQTWLPDAGVAPSPVTALLHAAVLVKIGVYVFARIFGATLVLPQMLHFWVPIIAVTSAIVSAGAALIETNLKRIIAYSTISQIGFIFFGLAVGNEMAITGALLYILMHGIAKAGLFLCAGIVEQNAKTKDITQLGGLIHTMPITAMAFLFCAFSVMGIPPFGGFFSKYLVFAGAIQSGQLWVSLAFFLGAILTILYLFRVFNMVFLGTAKITGIKEGSFTMVFSVALLGILSLLSGILVWYPLFFSRFSALQMLGLAG
ncbi:MAG: NADH-quinone oxidoreductase subunit L [Candidatus Omnitrophica bacterium]|nr:NADH-quinone oxidoreductase subunit L [Candidatus Omnitrophota bacterium]